MMKKEKREIPNPDYVPPMAFREPKVLYICDCRACSKCDKPCGYTTDINHAKNFRRMADGSMMEVQ